MTSQTTNDLDTFYNVTDEQITQFQRDGFIILKGVFSKEELEEWEPVITAEWARQREDCWYKDIPIKERDLYQQAFVQIMNLWQTDSSTRPFVLNKRTAAIATQLLGTRGVRMYHDQALYKEPEGGMTPWHTDQAYWPLATDLSVTAWVPFQDVPLEMGPLSYVQGSHKMTENRLVKISEESEKEIKKTLTLNDMPHVVEPFELGDVGFHYGFTYHRAEGNYTEAMRKVMTMIYMDSEMRLDVQEHNKNDAEGWCPGVQNGEIIDSHLNPILWEHKA